MPLPDCVIEVVEAALETRIVGAQALAGGQVSPAARVDTATGSFFVKWDLGSEGGRFALEAQGLEALAAAGSLRVPQVIAAKYFPPDSGEPSFDYVLLEYIPNGEPRDAGAFSRRFAEGLAELHRRSAAEDQPYGLGYDNFLGSQHQGNRPRTDDWATFYRDNRLLPQIEQARQKGLMPDQREHRLMAVGDLLDELLEGMPNDISLIHGDLWNGNFLCAVGDDPVLIDPAVYYAPREMEIAYIELFGGFPPKFVAKYNTAFPLAPDYPRRRSLHQLYPLLIHLNHFGETYGPSVDRVCNEYLSG